MSFASDIRKFSRKANVKLNMIYVASALEIFSEIVRLTPVGNPQTWKGKAPAGYLGGHARGNWQIGINSKVTEEIKGVGVDPVQSESSKLLHATVSDTIYISNNAPYIHALEHEGHSSQAPAGMVKVAVREYKRIVKEKAK